MKIKFLITALLLTSTPVMAGIPMCTLCPEGTYSDGTFSECKSCPDGKTSNTGASSVNDCFEKPEEYEITYVLVDFQTRISYDGSRTCDPARSCVSIYLNTTNAKTITLKENEKFYYYTGVTDIDGILTERGKNNAEPYISPVNVKSRVISYGSPSEFIYKMIIKKKSTGEVLNVPIFNTTRTYNYLYKLVGQEDEYYDRVVCTTITQRNYYKRIGILDDSFSVSFSLAQNCDFKMNYKLWEKLEAQMRMDEK